MDGVAHFVAQDVGDVGVPFKQALVVEQHHAGGGDGLGNRGDAVHGGVVYLQGAGGVFEAAVVDFLDFAVTHGDHRHAHQVEVAHDLAEVDFELGMKQGGEEQRSGCKQNAHQFRLKGTFR